RVTHHMAFGPRQCRVRRAEAQMESLTEVAQAIADFARELVGFVAVARGLLVTVLFKFTQVRGAPEMVRLITKGAAGQDGGISSFQALSMTLASRVGVGAIAGVATAIAAGGPGAIFWMAVTGLIGAASSYAESGLDRKSGV